MVASAGTCSRDMNHLALQPRKTRKPVTQKSAFQINVTCSWSGGCGSKTATGFKRYYNPETGRFISKDSIEEQGGVNLYGFVRNNGVNFIDPFGLEPKEPFKIAFRGAGAIDPMGAFSSFAGGNLFGSREGNRGEDAIVKYFDRDSDKKLTPKDCPPFRIKGVGYSWGGWTLLQVVKNIGSRVERRDDLKVIIGTVDPVGTARGGGAHLNTPSYVQAAFNVYQRNGCWGGCPGQSIGFGGFYEGQEVSGAQNANVTNVLYPPYANNQGRRRYYDHIAIQALAPGIVSRVESTEFSE